MYLMLSRMADAIARTLAQFGGALLILIVILSCVSITGRALFTAGICCGPIRGIYDYTEIAVGAAIFAFLPWCQLQGGQASVDLLENKFPTLMNKGINLIVDLAMAVVAILLAQRLYLGLLDKQNYGETTLIAQIPVWYGFALALIGAIGFGLVASFCALRSLRRFFGMSDRVGETQ